MLARLIQGDAAGSASPSMPPPLELEREESSYPQRGAASRVARAWNQFAALPYRLRALLGVLFVFAEPRDGGTFVRVSKSILAGRTGQSRRGVDQQLEELEQQLEGFAVVERSDRRANVYELPQLLDDELVARRPSMLPAWRADLRASCVERALLAVLLARGAGTERGAWPSARLLARQLGVSRATVFDTLAKLERRRLVVTRQLRRGDRLPDGAIVQKGGALRHVPLERLISSPPAEPGPEGPHTLDTAPRKHSTIPPAEPGPESLSADRALTGADTRARAGEVDAVLERVRALYAQAEPAPRFVADRERRKIVGSRLVDGYTVAELVRVAENAPLSSRWAKWWEARTRVDCLFRNGDTIRELLELRPLPKPRPPPASTPIAPPPAELSLEEQKQHRRELAAKLRETIATNFGSRPKIGARE